MLILKNHAEEAVGDLNEQEAKEREASKENEQNASSVVKEDKPAPSFTTKIDEWFKPDSPNDSQEGALLIADDVQSDEN
jgi:hypothetical protein